MCLIQLVYDGWDKSFLRAELFLLVQKESGHTGQHRLGSHRSAPYPGQGRCYFPISWVLLAAGCTRGDGHNQTPIAQPIFRELGSYASISGL